MSTLLDQPPYSPRDDERLLAELVVLTRHHLDHCQPYRRVWPGWSEARTIEQLPYLHASVFKQLFLVSASSVRRVVTSSATTGTSPSRIALDDQSSALQTKSSSAIMTDFVGDSRVPLVILDHSSALRSRTVAARVAAAMVLQPLSTKVLFALAQPEDPSSIVPDTIKEAASAGHLRVYGLTWMLWHAWRALLDSPELARRLANCRVDFVHSGGWKRLEETRVEREIFDKTLLASAGRGSRVVDYYGLVEQIGIVFPRCNEGARHVPRWAAIVVRDPHTLEPLSNSPGMIQLLNPLSYSSPCQSVLTEDLGILLEGTCPCGRIAPRFELLGRIPRAEIRGCANV